MSSTVEVIPTHRDFFGRELAIVRVKWKNALINGMDSEYLSTPDFLIKRM